MNTSSIIFLLLLTIAFGTAFYIYGYKNTSFENLVNNVDPKPMNDTTSPKTLISDTVLKPITSVFVDVDVDTTSFYYEYPNAYYTEHLRKILSKSSNVQITECISLNNDEKVSLLKPILQDLTAKLNSIPELTLNDKQLSIITQNVISVQKDKNLGTVLNFEVVIYREGKQHGKHIEIQCLVNDKSILYLKANVIGIVFEDKLFLNNSESGKIEDSLEDSLTLPYKNNVLGMTASSDEVVEYKKGAEADLYVQKIISSTAKDISTRNYR